MDYTGEHTWFFERYCYGGNKSILKELVNYGHTLILLDGLDKTPEVGRKMKLLILSENLLMNMYLHLIIFRHSMIEYSTV